MVAPPGLEPGHPKAGDFESPASTNSAREPYHDDCQERASLPVRAIIRSFLKTATLILRASYVLDVGSGYRYLFSALD